MNVCFCVHRLPYPPNSGGRIETFELISGLAKRGHDLTVITYCDDQAVAARMEREVSCTVRTVPGLPNRRPRNLLKNLASRYPLAVMKSNTPEYRALVRATSNRADILHLHALQTSFLASDLGITAPTVVRFNNVKAEIYRQFARYTQNPAKSAYAYVQYLKTRRYEGIVPQECDLTLAITGTDKRLLRRYGATAPINVLPAGVDISSYSPSEPTSDEQVITFFGSMNYHPNAEGAVWFAEKVFPQLRAEFGDVVLELVGKEPAEEVSVLARRDGIRVTGFVEDIRAHVGRASVVVIPIRVGTGVRMKALHALAMGKPIVSTPLGMQGIAVENGRDVSIAGTEIAFAEAVGELLTDAMLRERYGRNARDLVARQHDWSTIVANLEDYYRSLA